MSEHVAEKMGAETRKLKKLSFSGEIEANVKVTSISAGQRASAREAKEEKPPSPKSGAKKVSFSKELLDYAPRSKVCVAQYAYDTDKGGKSSDQGEKKVIKISKETME